MVTQCSKKWETLAKDPPFIKNMYQRNEVFSFQYYKQFKSASKSQFRFAVKKIILIDDFKQPFAVLLPAFSHLKSLNISSVNMRNDYFLHRINLIPVFTLLASSLRKLEFNYETSDTHVRSFYLFRDALGLLINLESLTLKTWCFNSSNFDLIPSIGKLINLVKLRLSPYFLVSQSGQTDALALLCTQPLSKLQIIYTEMNFPRKVLEQCEIHFLKLPSLHSIFLKMDFKKNSKIPTCFRKWLFHLELCGKKRYYVSNKKLLNIVSLSNLKSLELNHVQFNEQQVTQLINGLSSRLEQLTILDKSYISFQLLSKCTKLKIISLFGVNGLKPEKCELFLNCKELERISINVCDFLVHESSISESFTLPSKCFPKLIYVDINHNES
jgi:hypothetical protein